MQSRTSSAVETVVSTAIGFLVSMLVLEGVNRLYGLDLKFADNFAITSIFTIASLFRGYGVRRLFNWLHLRNAVSKLGQKSDTESLTI